jgi:hypothetical protein
MAHFKHQRKSAKARAPATARGPVPGRFSNNKIEPPTEIPDNLYEKLLNLMQKSEDSEEFRELVNLIGNASDIHEYSCSRWHDFWRYGLSLAYDIGDQVFYGLQFHFDTTAVRSGAVIPYASRLPAELAPHDSCTDVERKLGVAPTKAEWRQGYQGNSCDPKSRAKSYWQFYSVAQIDYIVSFKSEIDGGINELVMNLIE